MSFEIQYDGLDALNAKLKSVTEDVRKRGGRFALRKAAQLIRDEAKDYASFIDDPGTANRIADNIVVRWNGKIHRRSGDLGFRVGVLGGARDYGAYGEIKTGGNASNNPGGDTFYWRFVEFGTSHAPAHPFMRPALANNIRSATSIFINEYDKAIKRAIKRAAKK